MKKVELNYADIVRLHHILKCYMADYKEEMSNDYCQELEVLQLKIKVILSQLTYSEEKESE